MGNHSDWSPSRLKRIIECPGSVSLIKKLIRDGKIPEEGNPSEYAQHGTMLHEKFQLIASKNLTLDTANLELEDSAAVADCLEFYNNLMKSLGHGNFAHGLETEVSMEDWGLPEVFGTADVFIYDLTTQHMHVVDWKFGHTWVSPYKNPQLMAYAAGLISWPTPVKKITVYIGQPAHDNFEDYSFGIDDLYEWVHGTLAVAIGKSRRIQSEFNPGDEQCKWCEAATHCPAYIGHAQYKAIEAFKLDDLEIGDVTPEMILSLLDSEPLLKGIFKRFKDHIQNELESGRDFPGMKLVTGKANRKWKYSETAIAKWLAKYTEIDDIYRSKLVSPAQAEQLQRSLKKNDKFQKLFHKPKGKVSIARDTDSRPALPSASAAREAFDKFIDSEFT